MNKRELIMAKNLIYTGIVLVVLAIIGASTILLINLRVKQAGSRYIVSPQDAPKADAILVLGALVKADGLPSDMLHDRLQVALNLYNQQVSDKLLLSGDHGTKQYDEVNAMRAFMEQNQVKTENVFMDHAGFSTYESMYRARDVFKVKKVIIVTQDYHLKRAVYVARKMGLDAYGVASDLNNYRGIERFKAREVAARNKDFLYANILKPKPTYLGDAIPISGDGRLTHDK
jgi:SanA protein